MPAHSFDQSTYRDRRPGQEAQRQQLLSKRRADFAYMPHTIRRVYERRMARIGASVVLLPLSLLFIAATASHELRFAIASCLPGPYPATILSLLIAISALGVLSYFVARSRAHHRFTVSIRQTVLPGVDLDCDVERLRHETPAAVGTRMANRILERSVRLPIVAAFALLPGLAILGLYFWRAQGYPDPTVLDDALIATSNTLVALAGFGAVAALIVGAAAVRSRPLRTGAAITFAVCSVLLLGILFSTDKLQLSLATLGLLSGTIAYLGFAIQRENQLLAAEDPTAGSEIFEWRALLRVSFSAIKRGIGALTLENLLKMVRSLRAMSKGRKVAIAAASLGIATIAGAQLRENSAPEQELYANHIDMSREANIHFEKELDAPQDHAHAFTYDLNTLSRIDLEQGVYASMPELPIGWEVALTFRAEDNDFSLTGNESYIDVAGAERMRGASPEPGTRTLVLRRCGPSMPTIDYTGTPTGPVQIIPRLSPTKCGPVAHTK